MDAVETARQALCRMIAAGELRPGQKLPSEAELGARFKLSRSSLREAQRMLTVAGALVSSPGRRPVVSEMAAPQLMTGLAMVIPLMPLERLLELFTLREVLEGHVAACAAARLSDEECRELTALADELSHLDADDPGLSEMDFKFHERIMHGGGDMMISALLETIHKRGANYKILERGTVEHSDGPMELHDLKPISDLAHRRIAEAITQRDPEGARVLSMEHVRETRRWLEALQPSPTPD